MSNLLIIDDDPNTLASLARAFRLNGHEAAVADNADRALELLRSRSFDVVFSDVVMPGKNGIALPQAGHRRCLQTKSVPLASATQCRFARNSALDIRRIGRAEASGPVSSRRGIGNDCTGGCRRGGVRR